VQHHGGFCNEWKPTAVSKSKIKLNILPAIVPTKLKKIKGGTKL
jgi:hypothetical protein